MTVTKEYNPQNILVGEAGLTSSVSGSPPYQISGVAIGAGDTTNGQNGKKYWPESTLRDAAESLEGKNLVTDHKNTVHEAVGEVTKARFKNGEVQFQAELDDKELAEKIVNQRLDVSARIYHRDPEELEENEDGAKVIDLAYFDNLSFVLKPGASDSNHVELGASASMSAAELAESFEGESNPPTEETNPESEVDEVEENSHSEQKVMTVSVDEALLG